MSDDPSKDFLAQLLALAARNDCACEPCLRLRTAWQAIGLPEPPPSVPMCASCAAHPRGAAILRGAVGVGSVDGTVERCRLCGLPVNDEAPATREA